MSKASRSLRRMSKQTALGILSEIQRVLWEQWDPLGVNSIPEAHDEYDGYAGNIYDLLLRGAADDEMAQQLYIYETVNIGLIGSDKKERTAVVKALRAIDLNPPDSP